MKRFIIILFLMVCAQVTWAQSTYSLIQQGNKQVNKEQYTDAEIDYRKALEQEASLTVAEYNLGNTKYLLEDHDAAIERFKKAAEKFEDKGDKSHAYHNMGNSYLSKKEYENSIQAYKEALKLVPNNMDAKYNLAYAQLKLKKEQEQQEQENQDQEQDQEENEEEQDQEQEQDDQGEQEENQEEGEEEKEGQGKEDEESEDDGEPEDQEGEDEGEKPQPKEGSLSKEEADQLLQMLENEEAKLQEKIDEPEGEAVKIMIEKDW
ncbi:MAG: Ca-activated chloride channel family protein [Chitinophagales bacterium]|jgi:Ca-activated chloride channel family protein